MLISKKLKKVSEKLPREIGRIVSQAGQAIQDLSDAESIMKIGAEIEQEGLSMMEAAKKKLEEANNNVQENETPCSSDANNNASNNNSMFQIILRMRKAKVKNMDLLII